MKTTFFIIMLSIGIRLVAQSDLNPKGLNIYNADSLIKIAQVKGIDALKKIIDPIDLVYVDTSYASSIIDFEFKTGLWGKHYDNNKVTTYNSPDLTIKLADDFGNKKAGKKLFEYYCNLPKFSKSDTIYSIYGNLDNCLKVLVKFYSPQLVQKLKEDFNEWSKIARNSPKKKYQTIEEMRKMSFEESMKFKTSDLTIDCNYILLKIAGALNYLKVQGFDNKLLEKLKTNQSFPLASRYSFPSPINNSPDKNLNRSKTIQNNTKIKDFRKDYKKLEKIILSNFEDCCGSRIYEIIEKGPKAYVTMARNNGSDYYTVTLEPNNKIVIDLISFIIE